jgi:capsular exopolysaccharide synthesis family protein
MRTLDLRQYLRAIQANLRVVVAIAAVFGLAFGLYVALREPIYRAHARVAVEPVVDPVFGEQSGGAANALQPDMNTETQIAQSRPIAESVRETLGLEMTAQALLQSLDVETVRDTTVLEIRYTAVDAEVATKIANGFATAYLDARSKLVRDRQKDFAEPIQARIDELDRRWEEVINQIKDEKDPVAKRLLEADAITLKSQFEELGARLGQLEFIGFTTSGGHIVASATPPERPTGPSIPAASAFGVVLGALVGAGVTIVRKLLTDRVADAEEIEEQLGAPVIGVIPEVPGWTERKAVHLITREDPASHVSEAYRTLGTNIRFAASRRPLEILMVTSSLPEEGKSATASNLALVLAQSGLRTILVDADLRRPRAGKFLDVPPGPGFREALEGWRELVDVIQVSEVPGLAVLRSGEIPADPASLLSGPDVERVFAELRKAADFIVCDAPPVLPVADASILAAKADGVLFVHDPSISPKTALGEAVRQLRQAGGEVIGGVHNNVTRSQRTYLGYARYEAYYGSPAGRRAADELGQDGRSGRTLAFPPMPSGERGKDLERTRRERRS